MARLLLNHLSSSGLSAEVELPPYHEVEHRSLDNRELDKLVAALGRNKSTWRRALTLHQWLLTKGHAPDDRLCTTLIRVCSQHSQAQTALELYEWMRAAKARGGAGQTPTVFTYTAAMRAALTGNLVDRALKVWDDAMAANCQTDCRMSTTLIEVCARKGDTLRALRMYDQMRQAPADSRMAPSVHAYTAAMRAAAEGGAWEAALSIWDDMKRANCRPTGHAYAAVISACAAGGDWQRAVSLFDEMLSWQIKPDVVSCTALITALGADAQWQRAEQVVDWMHRSGVKPNVRTYTALVTALGNAQQWDRALKLLRGMKQPHGSSIEPNAYTYSALIKALGEQGEWQLAEQLFQELEGDSGSPGPSEPATPSAAAAASPAAAMSQADWGSPSAEGSNIWGQEQQPAGTPSGLQPLAIPSAGRAGEMSFAGAGARHSMDQRMSSDSFGEMPKHMAEQVLDSPTGASALAASGPASIRGLPDDLPGQSNASSPSTFSLFSVGGASTPSPVSPQPAAFATASPTSFESWQSSTVARPAAGQQWSQAQARQTQRPLRGCMNEVVCGAMMMAYERSGQFDRVVQLLERTPRLGVTPNLINYNIALSALGKNGAWQAAEQLFNAMPEHDAVTHETLTAAYGMAGQARKAEQAFKALLEAGHHPRDYAFTGLIAAHSLAGDFNSALQVRQRMRQLQVTPSVHVFNALIAACERAGHYEMGLQLRKEMLDAGQAPNTTTMQLMHQIGDKGIAHIERQQTAMAALSAAVAAAGAYMVRTGLF
eukprot:jgi/Astpho2/5237/Aster-04812